VRISGLTDFPLYLADDVVGYIPAPNQSGVVFGTNDWVFNELSMGTDRSFSPDDRPDILLIGDSLVLGGNLYAQREKLGPMLSESLPGSNVWPVSAGSWSLLNELAYLKLHPEVTSRVDLFVFVLNKEDFKAPSVWRSEATHPRFRSSLALVQIAKKANPFERPGDTPLSARDWRSEWADFLKSTSKRIVVVLYPHKDLAGYADLNQRGDDLQALEVFPGQVTLLRLSSKSEWTPSLYRDSIHPKREGNALLARFLVEAVTRVASAR
jgi:hypothetical protein